MKPLLLTASVGAAKGGVVKGGVYNCNEHNQANFGQAPHAEALLNSPKIGKEKKRFVLNSG